MSADNTIIILEMLDQYRVESIQAQESLYWSWIEMSILPKISFSRVYERFRKSKVFYERSDAVDYADSLDSKMFSEYGIQFVKVKKNWDEVVKLAREQMGKERLSIIQNTSLEEDVRESVLETFNHNYSSLLLSLAKEASRK